MAITYESVVVQQGDTLPSLAATYLGTQSRWREIAVLNGLRAPYISDRPADWYGNPLSIGILTDDIAEGDTTVTIPDENAALLSHGAILFLDGLDGDSHYVYAAPRIDNYDPVTGVVALLDPIQHAWALGSRYRVCPPPGELGTTVARSGTTLALPIVATGSASQVVTAADLIDILGTDLALGTDGTLALVGGDLATYSGMRNAQQGLWMRATLPEGESIWHPEEGNRAYILLGGPIVQQNIDAAALYTRAAVATDPRLAEVPAVSGSPDRGGAVQIQVRAILIDRSTEVRVNAVLREGS